MKISLFALLLSLLCLSGNLFSSDVFSSFIRLAADQVANSSSPADGLTVEEKEFYNQLTSDRKRAFLAMSEGERQEAMALIKKFQPSEALAAAVVYYVQTLVPEQQELYKNLSAEGKQIFFVLDDASTEQAALWAKKMPADQAVIQALQIDLSNFIPEQLDFYQKLTPENQIIYLALSDRVQENLVMDEEAQKDPNKAVIAAQSRDAARLYHDQLAFYQALNAQDKVIFLSLTPLARGMAVALTQGIDPSTAIDYLEAVQTS